MCEQFFFFFWGGGGGGGGEEDAYVHVLHYGQKGAFFERETTSFGFLFASLQD